MDIIIVLVFISLTLVVAGLVFFFSRLFEGDFEHGDRLSLLPLEDDDGMNQVDPENPDDKLDKLGFNDDEIEPDQPESSES
jgi:cbb3-type cytochrome oxidase maturation protein